MNTEAHHQAIVAQTKKWLEKVVIGLNFCPFAKKEFERKSIRYAIGVSDGQKDALSCLIEELSLLDKDQSIETTLIIYKNDYLQFDEYLDWLAVATSLVEQSAYRGIYQLASFHPDYCFEGENLNDAANYTNRSPFPMLHILRESSLEKVLKSFSKPELIPQRNIDKARELGPDYFKNLLK